MSAMMCACVRKGELEGGSCGEGFKLESYRKSKSVAVVAIRLVFVCVECLGGKKGAESAILRFGPGARHTEDLEIWREEELDLFYCVAGGFVDIER